jgi:D-alanyl-lipoteichoic acid acyltransferase DltB (MBOAT superfamily)
MYYTSTGFVLFLTLLFAGYYLVFRRCQWVFLLAAGYVYLAFSGWQNLIYISVTAASVFYAGWHMNRLAAGKSRATPPPEDAKALRAAVKKARRRWLILCSVFNFGILAVVKYSDFVVNNVNALLRLSPERRLTPPGWALPMGISFYTFKAMSYIIDVYRGKNLTAAESNPFRLALFVSFFPQIMQGPISRFGDMRKTLFGPHSFRSDRFSDGGMRVLWGFFKKLVVADRLLAAVKTLTADPEQYSGVYVLLAVAFYAVTLYADFTGGIDITIGVAKMLGIDVVENFDRPFYSKSIAEYWRRWHITMGTWFRDYLFFTLSTAKPLLSLITPSKKLFGERIGVRVPVYLVTLILWFATGLWHGAGWNFIAWGLANGVVIIISQELTPLYKRFHERIPVSNTRAYDAFRILRTFWLMSFIRSFDIYPTVGATVKAFLSVWTDFGPERLTQQGLFALGLSPADYAAVLAGTLIMIAVGMLKKRGYGQESPSATRLRAVCIPALFMAVLVFGRYGIGYDLNQFIYNRF